ncbi:hypothetical protein AB1Y20_023525 [Prymnesium parvum]|uniref:Uncharacterized protein n=1 Tax=Prymnesium parvum TaxID=97485 RepID=A0AB34JE04_PRYPA
MIGARPKEMFSKRTDTRKFTMEPHAYYDSAAELVESGSNDPVVLWRSKTRCSTFSEWMEVGSASDGLAAWRIESRFGDRCVPHSEGANSMCFITVLRVYRGYETKPQLLLVYRSHQSADITTTGSPKEVEVYLCNDDGADSMMESKGGDSANETFVFANLPRGEEAFTLTSNETFTRVSLTSTLPDDEESPSVARRVLAVLNRTTAEDKRLLAIDPALDAVLVVALFSAVDQLMISHDVIDYDVEWPQDYQYIMSGACLADRKSDRKSVRKIKTFTNGAISQEASVISSRMCPLPFFSY